MLQSLQKLECSLWLLLGIIFLPFARLCLKSREANVLAAPHNGTDKGVVVGDYLSLNCFLNWVLLRLRQLFAGCEEALGSLSNFVCIFQNSSTVHLSHLGLCASQHIGKHGLLVLITAWCLDMLKTLKQL